MKSILCLSLLLLTSKVTSSASSGDAPPPEQVQVELEPSSLNDETTTFTAAETAVPPAPPLSLDLIEKISNDNESDTIEVVVNTETDTLNTDNDNNNNNDKQVPLQAAKPEFNLEGENEVDDQVKVKVTTDAIKSNTEDGRLKIAIIGSGPGGASAAHYLHKFANDGVSITVFEKEQTLGGQQPIFVDSRAVELSGVLFPQWNKILNQVIREVGLESEMYPIFPGDVSIDGEIGSASLINAFSIWNGTGFDYLPPIAEAEEGEFSFKSLIPFYDKFYFYSLFGPRNVLKTEFFRKDISWYSEAYYRKHFPFNQLQVIDLLRDPLSTSGTEGLDLVEVGHVYRPFIEALSRAYFGQNLDDIHTYGSMVSLSSEGANCIYGGNYRVFKRMVERSKANINLNTNVIDISEDSNKDGFQLTYQSTSDSTGSSTEHFDRIIIADKLDPETQFNLDNITIPNSVYQSSSSTNKVKQYTTIFKSHLKLSQSHYFNSTTTPQHILTTSNCSEFTTISQIAYNTRKQLYTYKINSLTPLSPTFIDLLFNENDDEKNAEFVLQETSEWNKFEPVDPKKIAPLTLDKDAKLWFLNGFEQFVGPDFELLSLVGASAAGSLVQDSGLAVRKIQVL
ncbi:unnamed protein product [Ambrosiozyma monospora]|uniref:Unnamed protein product n=1 Tax=Ambrosiozyma monospora TaxID=43982 RepID=A0A9W7DDX5_AMBMO|nr:unnamed protein product [Ambrosiozyma monospora]